MSGLDGEGGDPAPIRVFIVDDHEIVRRGLCGLLVEAGGIEIVGECGSAAEAVRRIPALRPDLALIDVRLPDGSGVDVCREVTAADPAARVLIVTSHDDPDALLPAVIAGASGYVLKTIRGDALIHAVRRVAGGESLLDQDAISDLFDRLRRPASVDIRLASLTAREREVLNDIADGLTNREIGERLHLAEKTVKNHVTNVLAKLQVQRRSQAAVYLSRLLGSAGGHGRV